MRRADIAAAALDGQMADFRALDINRAEILGSLGAGEAEVQELLAYGTPAYDWNELPQLRFPWPDCAYVPVWEAYAEECERAGSIRPLSQYLVQLQFPVAEAMSQNEDYRAATRRAVEPAGLSAATGLEFDSPETCRILIHPTPAGKIPILVANERADFVKFVQALTERNEPAPIPDSMGACMVSGYNNIHRIRVRRQEWERQVPLAEARDWNEEFTRIIAQPELFRDQFIIVSEGPYSNTAAGDMGMDEEEWRRMSLAIRIEHECTHFFVRRAFSGTRFQKNMHEELAADYVGIKAAVGKFRSDWFLRFIGLENFPEYRQGGRLENYHGQPPLSNRALLVLRRLMKQAADNLERFDSMRPKSEGDPEKWALDVLAISSLSLEELAAKEGPSLITDRLSELKSLVNHNQEKAETAKATQPAVKEES